MSEIHPGASLCATAHQLESLQASGDLPVWPSSCSWAACHTMACHCHVTQCCLAAANAGPRIRAAASKRASVLSLSIRTHCGGCKDCALRPATRPWGWGGVVNPGQKTQISQVIIQTLLMLLPKWTLPSSFLEPQDSSSDCGSKCPLGKAICFPPGMGAMGLHLESHYCSFIFLRTRHSTLHRC